MGQHRTGRRAARDQHRAPAGAAGGGVLAAQCRRAVLGRWWLVLRGCGLLVWGCRCPWATACPLMATDCPGAAC